MLGWDGKRAMTRLDSARITKRINLAGWTWPMLRRGSSVEVRSLVFIAFARAFILLCDNESNGILIFEFSRNHTWHMIAFI